MRIVYFFGYLEVSFCMVSLAQFRTEVAALMESPHERPFVCSGSPIDCSVFIVGFNPATRLELPFWSFWADSHGFDRAKFINEYERARSIKGARVRLNAMVPRFPFGSVLETNICSEPTRRATDLKKEDRRTAIFQYLLKTIRPQLIFLHSNEPIKYFRALLESPSIQLLSHKVVDTSLFGATVKVCVSEGPLWRRRVAEMEGLADEMASHVKG